MMASITKRSWKLQEFVAHNANVNCLALGHKSGRVMVTGGDDQKVNLWAIGKHSCFMSLSGHTTAIECVQFNYLEELVCAGSRGGAIKVWDLEAAKLVRTLTGHRENIKCVDFHPYGDFLASGSGDTTIRMWDSRKKGCIFTYPGHKGSVNSLKFSPDGQWIASGGEDTSIKIWDLRVGRVLKEFKDHTNSVTCVEFHPHEFLLASGSADRTVNLFDLENFNLVSSESNLGSVRCVCFNPDGECLFAGVRDHLKVVGWEPSRLYDLETTLWGNICDISTAQNQLISQDFYLKFKNRKTLATEFPLFINKIERLYARETRHEPPTDWDNDTNGIITLLHLFPPIERGRGGVKMASVGEALDRFIKYYEISTNLNEGLSKKDTTQPFLAALGWSKKNIVSYFVVVDNYPIPTNAVTPLGAIDELFKRISFLEQNMILS